MADYLSSVVARANPTTPSLSPRVPSLFEPPATLLSVPLPMPTRRQAASPGAMHDRLPTPDARISVTGPQLPETGPPDANTRPAQQQSHELNVAVEINRDAPTRPPPARLVSVPSSKAEAREPEPTLELVEPEAHDTLQPLVTLARPHEASAVPAMLVPAPMRNSHAQAERRADPAPPITAARPEPGAREPVKTVNLPPSAHRSTDPVRQSPSPRDRAVASLPLELEAQRPVVNVVIERLSVQAITNTSAPPRPSAPAPPPSMSLEQYLQRRSTRP
jgi:hypothetical protein